MYDSVFDRAFAVICGTAPFAGLAVSLTSVNQALQTVSLLVGIVLGLFGLVAAIKNLKSSSKKK
jgi:hypothetical protein